MRLEYSITVTWVPRREKTLPSSKPIMPPPITLKDSGILCNEIAPVDDKILFSSIYKIFPGKLLDYDPVAITIFYVRISLLFTCTVLLSFKLAVPLICSTPYFFSKLATPLVKPDTALLLPLSICAQSGFTFSRITPCFLKLYLASTYL